ncbi:hypothetical protein NDU88_007171 [Pleurodeles waltl]|uniref:Uncharacterized protein n=1 Tax=Pleurodeles waltl TaxID=8319 RepID=A0AAV7P1F1_PLEWA|nr:hypothetical protein NDU88_007171 [Pleurodeles waltl]
MAPGGGRRRTGALPFHCTGLVGGPHSGGECCLTLRVLNWEHSGPSWRITDGPSGSGRHTSMVRNKGQLSPKTNKMDKYAVLRQPVGPVTPDNVGRGRQEADQDPSGKPTLGTIMAAIQDLTGSLEPKLDTVMVDVTLLRAALKKVTEKVTIAETVIARLQSTSKGLEDQVQFLTVEQERIVARLEDQEGRVGRGRGVSSHQQCFKRNELRSLPEQHARAYVLAPQLRLYDVGDIANKLLAWLDKRDQERSWVREVQNKEEVACRSNESIAEAFDAYYKEVYTSVTRMTEEDCMDLLQDIPLLGLSEVQRGELDAELTVETMAIKANTIQCENNSR